MEAKRIGAQIRDIAISLMIIILLPFFIRYGVRVFFGTEFPVWPLIGLGFIVLSAITQNILLSWLFLIIGAQQLMMFMGFWYESSAFDNWYLFLAYGAVLVVLGYMVYQHDRYQYDPMSN